MKKYIILIFLFYSGTSYSQFDLSAGMGLCYFSAADMKDYINNNFALPSNELNTFNSSADFFIELGYNLKKNYQVAVEYNFNIFSFNSPLNGGIYNLSVDRHKPSVIAYYVLSGNGYKIKLGAGAGLRYLQAEETIGQSANYSTSGIGFLLKAQGDTKLGKDFFAVIATELRYDSPGKIHTLAKEKINFNSISVGLKLGVSYYF